MRINYTHGTKSQHKKINPIKHLRDRQKWKCRFRKSYCTEVGVLLPLYITTVVLIVKSLHSVHCNISAKMKFLIVFTLVIFFSVVLGRSFLDSDGGRYPYYVYNRNVMYKLSAVLMAFSRSLIPTPNPIPYLRSS